MSIRGCSSAMPSTSQMSRSDSASAFVRAARQALYASHGQLNTFRTNDLAEPSSSAFSTWTRLGLFPEPTLTPSDRLIFYDRDEVRRASEERRESRGLRVGATRSHPWAVDSAPGAGRVATGTSRYLFASRRRAPAAVSTCSAGVPPRVRRHNGTRLAKPRTVTRTSHYRAATLPRKQFSCSADYCALRRGKRCEIVSDLDPPICAPELRA